jgi:hypothetical protein
MRRSTLVTVVVLMLFGATLLWASNRLRGEALTATGVAAGKQPPPVALQDETGVADRLRRVRVRPGLRDALDALGDRMVKPGRERLLLTATLAREGENAAPVHLVREFPNLLRVEGRASGAGRTSALVFDGARARRPGGDVSRADEDLIETLVYDSAEYFFQGQIKGSATRFLGSGFRLDGGETPDLEGPTYSVYQIVQPIRGAGEARERVKLYYFNAATHLLERVKYDAEREGTQVSVEVLLGDWQAVEGQRVPGRIVRTENGAPVFDLKATSAAFSSRAQDGTFGATQH